MTLKEAYNIGNEEVICETTKPELLKLYKKVKNGSMTMEQVLKMFEVPTNYTELKYGEEKPQLILNGFNNPKNPIQEFKNEFTREEQGSAQNFITQILRKSRDTMDAINSTRRNDIQTANQVKKQRHEENLKRYKTNVEFHGYGS